MAEPTTHRRQREETEDGEDRPDEGAGVLGELAVDVLEDVVAWLPDGEHAYPRAASRFMRGMVDWSRARRGKEGRATKTLAAAAVSAARMPAALAALPMHKIWYKYRPCVAAAYVGNVEMLKWLRADGYLWDELTCEYAARGGQLETLRWLRANGCRWDKWTCARAAKGGQVEMLKWLRANGCPWDARVCRNQAGEVLAWAHSGAGETWPCACEPCAYAREHRTDAIRGLN
jgi:hypothetical protein